jgi:Rod binding domain-containing protein
MMDNELAEKLSQAGNFGIAEALIRQFGGNVEDKNK